MNDEEDDYGQRLGDKLAPATVGAALIRAGAFLTGYELVKSSILDGPVSFFSFDLDPVTFKPIPSADYEREVSARGKGKWAGSVAWLVDRGAVTAEQADVLDRIRAHRGEIAHELARLLVDPDAEVDVFMLRDLRGIMQSLDRFWGRIEVDIQADLYEDYDSIDFDGIKSGSGLLLDYLCDLAGLEGLA